MREKSSSSSSPDADRAFSPRPAAARRRAPSLVDVVLDAAQRLAVEQPRGGALLVLGEAGHGKTTVALHRLAHLWRSSATPLRAAVVVPTDGLARLIQPLMRRLGVDLEVLTYDCWASRQARRVFRRLPRESDSTPPSVMRVKRHPALRLAVDEVGSREPGRIDEDADAPAPAKGVLATRGDLQHLFGDRVLLQAVARVAKLPDRAVVDTLDRTRVQFSLTAEEEWSHVTDRERLVAVDRRQLDEGTASGEANTIDVEDYAVLFELERQRAARRGTRPGAKMKRYDVLMLDEAQEFAPLELALLGRSLEPGGTLIVAGDADQQTDETTTFRGWHDAMVNLGWREYGAVTLEVGYRCPPDVVTLARAIVGRGVPDAQSAPARATALHSFQDEAALSVWLAREAHAILRRDRRASIAVLCRSPLTARRVAGRLQAAEVPARLVFDGHFLMRGPVQVTTVDEVKGLEFDFVVVPDAGARDYPDDAAARRALYVAVTRARHQVALACAGARSPIVPWAEAT